ncbi:MAG TPA: phage tail protein [Ktedonobacteraceae bacterium]
MLDPGPEAQVPPYTAFRFEVELTLKQPAPGIKGAICRGAFAECDGLEMTMEPKAIREGGNNQVHYHRIGPVSYGQLTLKRGMTDNHDLWNWFAAAGMAGRKSCADGRVTIIDAAGKPRVTFTLTECLPVKLRGPSLNAKDGQIAIEEMQLVYSQLTVRGAGEPGAGVQAGAGFSAGASATASVSGGFGLSGGGSFSASASATAGLDIG